MKVKDDRKDEVIKNLEITQNPMKVYPTEKDPNGINMLIDYSIYADL